MRDLFQRSQYFWGGLAVVLAVAGIAGYIFYIGSGEPFSSSVSDRSPGEADSLRSSVEEAEEQEIASPDPSGESKREDTEYIKEQFEMAKKEDPAGDKVWVRVEPEKVRPGDTMEIEVRPDCGSPGASSVTAVMPHEEGEDRLRLTRTSEDDAKETWTTSWTVHDTIVAVYQSDVEVVCGDGEELSDSFYWYDPTFYRVNAGESTIINEHGTEKEVANNGSKDIFVPTNTEAEWDGFRDNAPSSIDVADASTFTCGDTVDDVEGNTYGTVDINGQCWMTENMRTTTYPDGTSITKGPSSDGASDWGPDQGYYSCPPNSSWDGEDCAAADSLGMLYQWSAAMDGSASEGTQGICPDGWHVPTDAELHALEDYLQESGTCEADRTTWDCNPAGSKLAGNDAADENWSSGDLTDHSDFDSTGFNAPPSGFRRANGNYDDRSVYTDFWTSTKADSGIWKRHLADFTSEIRKNVFDSAWGISVRCLMN